tara:strand:- start:100 stop:1227 length:1128 start_codon:yes stop_codon:yes gene_type:complete
MPYQGNTPIESYTPTVKDSFSGNGSTTAFTLSQPTVTNDVRVVVENVVQDPTVAYTVLGTTLTFTSAPVSGTNNIYVVHLGPAVATTQPPSDIANATTFASNLSVQGLFNSVGIDDNANATAITIDSSEVVLIGKTSNTFSQQGVALRANNDSQITRDAGIALSLNRTTNDGAILGLYKNGATVGSINVGGGNVLAIGQGSNYIQFHNSLNSFYASDGSGGRDNAMDIGASGVRFKDLYLSGGVYLGGTGAANKLDDYEEGTWTPSIAAGGFSGATGTAYYTKIGRVVNVIWEGAIQGTGTSVLLKIGGLPFSAVTWSAGSMYARYYTDEGSQLVTVAVRTGDTNLAFVTWGDEASGDKFSAGYFAINITYNTAS